MDCSTPLPVAYIAPKLNCAMGSPCSAALRSHFTASSSFVCTPAPKRYMEPSSSCVETPPVLSRQPTTARSESNKKAKKRPQSVQLSRLVLIILISVHKHSASPIASTPKSKNGNAQVSDMQRDKTTPD